MILVTGGAGYIGSHVVKELLIKDKDVLVLDNLTTGHIEVIDILQTFVGQTTSSRLEFVIGDTGDRHLLCSLMRDRHVEAVVHLAAYSQVGESMQDPGKYFENNVAKAICLLESMVSCGVRHIVFSSTAAVYGEPDVTPIIEETKLDPTNVYGTSKLMVEQILQWYSKIYPISYVSLRYFNASGADESGLLGEWHVPETHLIPIVLQYALGQRNQLIIFGDNYDTEDGTCIRDYIHVTDLAKAHILALEALNDGMCSRIFMRMSTKK
jgi:UDP-glucose 4-epimerase